MFERFLKHFVRDPALSMLPNGSGSHLDTELTELTRRFGGSSFENGLYRVIRSLDVDAWDARVATAFPEFGDRISCFGYDWLGRAFAIDRGRFEQGLPGVVMFELGSGDILDIPCNVISFHDEELIEYTDAALAKDFYYRWVSGGGSGPKYCECIGYKVPLFVGGLDELQNLEICDIDVYWSLVGQLIVKTRGLPRGAPIRINS